MDELATAVARGHAEAVARLLEAGADPDTLGDDGLPVLCRAVAGYDVAVASALVEGGADQDRKLPDGTTALIRAIDGGSPSLVTAVLGWEPRLRLPAAVRERLLGRARHWYEVDKTGAFGPVHRTRVMDDEYCHVTQLTLGGTTVRAGHGAILTHLEWAFHVLTPVDELAARALSQGDPDHVDWSSVRWALSQRESKQTWSAVSAYRHARGSLSRLFALDVLLAYVLGRWTWREETADLLVTWAMEGEEDPEVLAELLRVLGETEHAEFVTVGLRYARHPDPRVRAKVPDLLAECGDTPASLTAETRAALFRLVADEDWHVRAMAGGALCRVRDRDSAVTDVIVALLSDPEAEVRAWVAEAVSHRGDRSPAVADALFALLDKEDDVSTRLNAVYGLIRREDPRIAEAVAHVGSDPYPDYVADHRLSAIWHWERHHRRGNT
ncbi:HEAT repeat domain-containing protein [Streptomyces sp. NPDC093250]|uniref:HEAT repeat domain-containing protein n=1 Tax=Streptomyces sp. NPDC093250 TaxID=3366036 RepID=UPI00382217BD